MKHRTNNQGNVAAVVLLCLLVITAIGVGGWYVWHNAKTQQNVSTPRKQPTTVPKSRKPQKATTTKPADPSEGGKYLVIKEWGIRAKLPTTLQGKVAYVLNESAYSTDPDTGLPLSSVDIYIESSAMHGAECGTIQTNLGTSVLTAIQYIRSDASKPFNAGRYKGTFKKDVLADAQYEYHLNYVTPDCIGGIENQQKVLELQDSLTHLSKI